MTGLEIICSELFLAIIAHDWHDVRVSVAPVTHEIRATHFIQDTADMCAADGFDDFGFTYNYDEKVVLK